MNKYVGSPCSLAKIYAAHVLRSRRCASPATAWFAAFTRDFPGTDTQTDEQTDTAPF